jgi:hypothetical protein
MFVDPKSTKLGAEEEYYCIVSSLFFPWSEDTPQKPLDSTWKDFFELNQDSLAPRLQRCIDNFQLLHKTKEETRIDRLQRNEQEISFSGRTTDESDDDNTRESAETDDGNDDLDLNVLYPSAVEDTIADFTELGDDW